MRLRTWQIFSLSIFVASGLRSQEVRRALPVVPTPVPAPRAQPVHPEQFPGSQSILGERIPSSQSSEPSKPVESNPEPKASRGSVAEPDTKDREKATEDEIRLAPNQGQNSQA